MSDNDPDACSETDKLPNPSNDLLNVIWKTMQDDKIDQDRSRLETEEKQKNRRKEKAGSERTRKEDKERLKHLIQQIREEVQQMKEGWLKRYEDRASKPAVDIVDLEKKTQHSVVEVNNKIQSVEEMQCQRMSETKDSPATTVTELVEFIQSVKNSLSMFRNELFGIMLGINVKIKFTQNRPLRPRGGIEV
jgi:uncharacterized FlaG/YvyC family protein